MASFWHVAISFHCRRSVLLNGWMYRWHTVLLKIHYVIHVVFTLIVHDISQIYYYWGHRLFRACNFNAQNGMCMINTYANLAKIRSILKKTEYLCRQIRMLTKYIQNSRNDFAFIHRCWKMIFRGGSLCCHNQNHIFFFRENECPRQIDIVA